MDWEKENLIYLKNALSFLQLILERKILWLRKQWNHDPIQNYRGMVISNAQIDWLLTDNNYIEEQGFYHDDSKAQKLTLKIEEEKSKLDIQSQHMKQSGTPSALDMLIQIYGLTQYDRMIMLLCAAPELDPSFEGLYAYIQDNATRKYVTAHLVFSLFSLDIETEQALYTSFFPDSPLFRYRLIERKGASDLTSSGASSPLRISPRINEFILGKNHPDERLSDIIAPVYPVEPLPCPYEKIVSMLKTLIKRDIAQSSIPMFNFTGSAHSGKTDVASKLCESLEIGLYRLKLKRLQFSDLKLNDLIKILERECMLLPAALYIDASEIHGNNDMLEDFFREIVERLNVLLIIASPEPLQFEREFYSVPVSKLSAKEQAVVWKKYLDGCGANMDNQVEAIIEQFDFEPDMIKKAITTARTGICSGEGNSSDLTCKEIWQTCSDQCRQDLDMLAQRIIPCYSWQDIVLPNEILGQIKDIASQVEHRPLVYEKWGFGAKMSRGRGVNVLFSGPSGTGKTMAAEILAHHLNLDLYRIDLSSVVNKYIGETEKNLRRVFDAADRSGVILFFDEADALFGKRSEIKDSHDRYANIEIDYLLQRMEDYRGLAILATNMKSLLDQALFRRMRFHVEFPFPNATARQRIWQKSFPSQAKAGKLDFTLLARLEIPGGNIKNIVLNAAFLAANNGHSIQMSHILCATKREYNKIGKMILESEFGPYYEKMRR